MLRRCFWICLVAVAIAPAEPPAARIEALLSGSASARRAFWGVQILDPERNEVLFERNAEHYFLPASNTKLFTGALALTRLGPDYRFRTRVIAAQAPDAAGCVRGDVYLIGGGDPTISNRAYPYVKGPQQGDPLRGLEELAQQVWAAGVRRIEGDVIGDDTAYVWEPYPEGWTLDDALWEYGAPVSALTVNDNTIRLRLESGEANGMVRIRIAPPLDYYWIENRLRVGPSDGGLRVERLPGSRQLRLWGMMAPRTVRELSVAIDDPALYAARAFAEALRRRGVTLRGDVRVRHRFAHQEAAGEPSGVELAMRSSPPLIEILRVVEKVSQNLHAELLLREVARVLRREGSREAGIEELGRFLTEAGIPAGEYRFFDGSGLSRLNLVTPAATVRLLTYMYRGPHREAWLSLLPVGAEDGTLSSRFREAPDAGRRVRAKTGTLARSSALAGYVESSRGPLVFSIFANHYVASAAEIRSLIDKIVLLLAE